MSVDIIPTGQVCGATGVGFDLTQPLTEDDINALRSARSSYG